MCDMSLKTAVFLMSGTYFPSNAHTHTQKKKPNSSIILHSIM